MADKYLDFDEYIIASEPHKLERAEAWKWPSAYRLWMDCRCRNYSVDAGQVQGNRRKNEEGI